MEEKKGGERASASKSIYQPFPADQTEIEHINDDGFVLDRLKLDETDPIFAETFRQMITDHFAEGKHFFVAKILSKNVNWAAATSPATVRLPEDSIQAAPLTEQQPAPPQQTD